MELDPQESPGEIKRREVELDPQESPEEMKSREMEHCSHSRIVCLAVTLFLNSCFTDTVFVTLLRSAVGIAISGVPKLLRTGGVPTSLTLLFWRRLTVSSVFAGRRAQG